METTILLYMIQLVLLLLYTVRYNYIQTFNTDVCVGACAYVRAYMRACIYILPNLSFGIT